MNRNILVLWINPMGNLFGIRQLSAITVVGFGLLTASISKNAGAASGLSMIFIFPMMVFGTFLTVFNEMTYKIAKFTPNFYATDSLMRIYNGESLASMTIWTNFLILTAVSVTIAIAGIFLFRKAEFK